MSLDESIKIAKQLGVVMKKIREVALETCWSDEDDFCPMEFSGENFDDAYQGGKEAGKVIFARELLELLEKAKS